MAYLNDNPQIPIAARSLSVLKRKVGRVEPLSGTRNDNVLMVDPGDHRRQVWVRPSYTSYRDAWLRVHLHVAPQMDVDHVYNRARAQVAGYEYVRLVLCPATVNQRHGSFLERRLTDVERRRLVMVPRDELVFASNWTIAKMAGVAVDRASPTYNQQAALDWLYANHFI